MSSSDACTTARCERRFERHPYLAGEWSPWGECSVSCGGGMRSRQYSIVKEAERDSAGKPCPHPDKHVELSRCNEGECPAACEGSWGEWGECSSPCGRGRKSRRYRVTAPARGGGPPCRHDHGDTEEAFCERAKCPDDCPGRWSEWSACAADCDRWRISELLRGAVAGTQHRAYHHPAEVEAVEGDDGALNMQAVQTERLCPHRHGDVQVRTCEDAALDARDCPVEVRCPGRWGAWGACSAPCGGGSQERKFTLAVDASSAGEKKKKLSGGGGSHTKGGGGGGRGSGVTAADVSSSSSSSSSEASALASTVEKAIAAAGCEGERDKTERRECNLQTCPDDCKGTWQDWEPCSASCGSNGHRRRVYAVNWRARRGGAQCPHEDGELEVEPCNRRSCPVNCAGEWAPWSECSRECGDGGHQSRTFRVTAHAAFGGSPCAARDGAAEKRSCNTLACVPGDCVGRWDAWSDCSARCGTGFQTRAYLVEKPAHHSGKPCSFRDGSLQSRACNRDACAVRCEGEWSEWSACSAECGGGQKWRTYTVTRFPEGKGAAACPVAHGASEVTECGVRPCPRDCRGRWAPWSRCSATCGGGEQLRNYVVLEPAANGGLECPFGDHAEQRRACNEKPCNRDCVGEWDEWSECGVPCGGGGVRRRTFRVSRQHAAGGKRCEARDGFVQEDATCNSQPCVVNCEGRFTPWSQCSRECGPGGTSSRRFIVSQREAGGESCTCVHVTRESTRPSQLSFEACRYTFTSVDNESESVFMKPCLFLHEVHSLVNVLLYIKMNSQTNGRPWCQAGGGAVCRHAHESLETRPCNENPCPADCVGEWSRWSECSQFCGAGGVRERTYKVTSPARDGGRVCPFTGGAVDIKPCNEHITCDADCEGGWTPWGECSSGCRGGFQRRVYAVRKEAAGRGSRCPQVDGKSETRECPLDSCAPNLTRTRGPPGSRSVP